MKSEGEVRKRLQDMIAQEYGRRLSVGARRLPCNCRHHLEHQIDVRHTVLGERNERYNRLAVASDADALGLCGFGMQGKEWNGNICEDVVDAQRCPMFESRQSKDEIIAELDERFADQTWLARNVPAIHSLLWALGEAPGMRWWHRLLVRLWPFRVERQSPETSPLQLLEGTRELP